MLTKLLLLLSCLCLGFAEDVENENRRGYPVYYGSFEDVGKSRVETDVLPVHLVDKQLTQWTKGCPADAFVIVRDSNPFQLSGLKRLQRAAENSLTTGSFLSDFVVNVREFGLDLEEYCEGKFVEVDVKNLTKLERYTDTRTRIFYIEFEANTLPEIKNATLTEVFARIPTPFVSIAYVSTFQQAHPVWRSLQLNPKRSTWQRKKLRHEQEKIAPVIAPLFGAREPVVHDSEPGPYLDLPDNFFFTLLIGSFATVAFLIYRDFGSRKKATGPEKEKAAGKKD